MWSLPKTLEILNLSFNSLKRLNVDVMRQLTNLTTLDISNNGVESLDGLQHATRLKRLLARSNQVQNLEPMFKIERLIEIDLENNPIDSAKQVLLAVQNKRDILILNLKLAPLMVKVQNYDEFVASVDKSTIDHKQDPVQDFKNLLTFLHNGSFYRRKKIYLRIKQQQQTFQLDERRFSNFSNDEDSSNGVVTNKQKSQSGAPFKNLSGGGSGTNPYRRTNEKLPCNISKNQRTNSTGQYHLNLRKHQTNNLHAQKS